MSSAEGGAGDAARRFYQVVILGGGGVGKSCLTFRLVHNQFLERYDPTIEDSYRKDNFQVDGEVCPIEIMDTAGQDTYTAMRDLYYKKGDGFLLVYSITDSSSLDDVKERFNSLLTVRGVERDEIPPVTLVGNKCDLEDDRVVPREHGAALAADMGAEVGFVETSAKEGINVEKVFEDIVRRIKTNDKNSSKAQVRGLKSQNCAGGKRRCRIL